MKTLKEMMNLIDLPEIVQTELLSIESTYVVLCQDLVQVKMRFSSS